MNSTITENRFMKSILTIIGLSFIALVFQSQTPVDPKAQTILEKVKTKYSAYKSIQASFKMVHEDKASDMVEESEGEIWLKDNMFRLEFGQNEIVSNGKDLWIYLQAANQVQILTSDPDLLEEEFGFAPNELFNIDQNDFDYRLVGETTIESKSCNEIELSPKDKEKLYYKLKMYTEKSSNEVKRARFYQKDGIEFQFDILKQSNNVSLSNEFFTFDKSKYGDDLQVEDLRNN